MPSEQRWYVVCPNYTAGPFLLVEQARKKADAIAHMGNCPERHITVPAELDEHRVWRLPDGRMAP